ncbi:hypothetical protein CL634_01945 [bacterium]|nr:hypothetical protein [bacterium]
MSTDSSLDVLDVDSEKLADLFNRVKSKVSVDQEVIHARSALKHFNEYIFDETNNIHHINLCDALDTGEDVAGIIPRNSGKSTIVSGRFPAYSLGQDRGLRFILASHTAVLAQSFSRSIEAIFKLDKFKLLFGDMIPPQTTIRDSDNNKWNETEKMVKDRPVRNKLGFRVDAKDASIFAVGVGGAVVGRRSDKIILDDIIDRNSVKTEAQLSDIKYWYNEELKGSRHRKTQTVVVGSRWNEKDIYVYIMSTMLDQGADVSGNMVEEVQEQIRRYRELEQEVNV